MSVPDPVRPGSAPPHRRYGAILDNTEIGFCVLEMLHDGAGRAVDYRFVETNPAFERETGLRNAVGRTARALVPGLEQAWVDTYAAVDASREATRFESGSEAMGRWFEVYAFPVDEPALHRVGLLFNDISARRAAEEELRRSEERFRVFAQAMPNQVWAAQADGTLDWFNDAVYAYTGHEPGSLDGRGAWEPLIHPDDLPDMRQLWWRSLSTGEVFEHEFRMRRHDGAYRWLLARALPVRDEAGAVIRSVGSSTDIDEKRRRTAELARLNATLEDKVAERTRERDLIWAASTDLLCVADLQGWMIEINPAWTATTGWSEAELKARPFHDFVHPDDREATAAAADGLARGVPALAFENRYRCKDGSYRWLSWNAVPREGRIYGTVRDVTAMRRQAEELAQRTAERDRVWQTTNDLMGTAGLDGRLRAINPAWTRLLGRSEAELLSLDPAGLVDPQGHEEMAAVLSRLSAGERVDGYVNRLRTREGVLRTIQWAATPDVEAGVFHMVGRDVTEQAQAEDALRQSQKMEAVGQLTGGIAHDFNNLLAGISGSLEMIETRLAQGRGEEVGRYVAAAQGAARRAAALTHRLLAFSRRQTLAPRATDAPALVAGLEDLVRRTVGPSIVVETEVGGAVGAVLVDPNQLENALLNLCINGRDAMPDGGRLRIAIHNRQLGEREARELDLAPGPYVSICVTDDGTGMEPAVLERAMEPFFTTKPIGMGTGLGLSMIYGFARQSGGQVRIRSAPGQGTQACLVLPLHAGSAEPDAGPPADAAPAEGGGRRVLVIDDEPLVRMLVVDVLDELGYTALEAEDGPSGLAIVRSDQRIDLLITDVGLPNGMNGRQVADAARQLRPRLKVLFVTGYAENAVLNRGDLEPGMAVVTKPFDMRELGRRIGALLDGDHA
ncbi:PAS domain S-box protein [Aureimonas sp. SK2]|uniref:PAS domain S-box protein n=1 Tax=Aureimonas sp. SK2 TaxID=3015992 RepID=UPI0024440AC1|nr:PAS domain S-box protein [Aureimonas sp. SK2]